jgi:hypothetical protein
MNSPLTTSFSSVRFYLRLSPRSVSLSCFRFPCHDASPDLRWRAVISCASLIAWLDIWIVSFFLRSGECIRSAGIHEEEYRKSRAKSQASWWLSSMANQRSTWTRLSWSLCCVFFMCCAVYPDRLEDQNHRNRIQRHVRVATDQPEFLVFGTYSRGVAEDIRLRAAQRCERPAVEV